LNTVDEYLMQPEGPRGAAKAAPRRSVRLGDPIFGGLTRFGGAMVAIAMFSLAATLVWNAWPAITQLGTKTLGIDWAPSADLYGMTAALVGTVLTTIVAMIVAVPLALVIALLLTELVHPSVARVIGTAIEMLAAIPSIIFGLWGISVIVPIMQNNVVPWISNGPLGHVPFLSSEGANFQGGGYSVLTTGLVLAVMVLPFITAVSRDVLNMVPRVTKEAGFGMGSTTWEVTRKISLRYSLSGIVGACFIGLGRALGETMAVAFIIGSVYTGLPHSLLDGGTTIASLIANQFNEATDLGRAALIEMGLVLFLITLVFQALAQVWLRRAARATGGRV
jgi:phosphate transport system permease protein